MKSTSTARAEAAGGTARVARKALVTGATGFIGGRLAASLVERGWEVRCLVRDRGRATSLAEAGMELHEGDALDAGSLRGAGEGVEVAYYLMHAMGRGWNGRRGGQRVLPHAPLPGAEAAGDDRAGLAGDSNPGDRDRRCHLLSGPSTRCSGIRVGRVRPDHALRRFDYLPPLARGGRAGSPLRLSRLAPPGPQSRSRRCSSKESRSTPPRCKLEAGHLGVCQYDPPGF